MNRLVKFNRLVLLVGIVVSGCSGMQSMGSADSLVKLLTNQLGVTENQATGGVGSSLSLAKEKLPSTDFNMLKTAIPGADTFMTSAKDQGAVTGPVRDRAGLESAYSRLGMGPDMVGKFTQVIGNFVGKAGGEPVKNLLAMALK